nr:hypothetical protein [uncultured Campylobacter sp.]
MALRRSLLCMQVLRCVCFAGKVLHYAKQNFGGLNFAAAIFKFMRLNFTDLREPPFATDLLPV